MKGRSNSVLSTNAQIKKPCQPGSTLVTRVNELKAKLEANRQRLGRYYELGVFMFHSGCRVSEALNIRPEHITTRGAVQIKGLKGSENRLVSINDLTPFFLHAKANNIEPFHHMNRFSCYRLYKELGIGKLKKGRLNMSVTHSFRDEFVKDTRSIEMNERDRSKSIGHKSIKSTEFYGKD